MDIHFSSIIILLFFLAFLAKLFKAITWSKPRSNPNPNLPPGPRKLPFVGNLHLFASSLAPHRVLADLASKYGPWMHLQLGEVSTIVVSSPEAAKEILKTHDINFANRPSILATEIVCYNNTGIAYTQYGEYYRQVRKICTLELLSTRCVQSFRSIRVKEFSNLCRWIASKQGSTINLTERVALTTWEAFIETSIGKKNNTRAILIPILKEFLELTAGFSVADVYPSIKQLQRIGGMKGKLEKLHKILDRTIEEIINDHRVSTSECKQRENLLDVLLKFNDAGHELYLTTTNIKAVLVDIFAAGMETSATTVDWTMAEMAKHPRVLKKAQDEVRHVFKDKGFVDESDFDQLQYLKLVIKETLRMHPPLPLLLPRENSESCEINGYRLPAKTRVMVNAWAIGRDPKYWKQADNFIPERFLDKPADYKGIHFEYLPFGAGRRICPGMTSGLANVELMLAMLLYHFDWVFPENVDMTESFGVTALRANPLYVIPAVKNPLPTV